MSLYAYSFQDVCVVDKNALYLFDSNGNLKKEFFKGAAAGFKALSYENDTGELLSARVHF